MIILLTHASIISSTQPTDARYAFPCWDEPVFKATFSITLVSRAKTVNLANMPVRTEHLQSQATQSEVTRWLDQFTEAVSKDEWKITVFETTPPVGILYVSSAYHVN